MMKRLGQPRKSDVPGVPAGVGARTICTTHDINAVALKVVKSTIILILEDKFYILFPFGLLAIAFMVKRHSERL